MNLQDILQRKVSFQPTPWDPISYDLSISEVLSDIRSAKYSSRITNLRLLLNSGDLEAYNIHKKTLPSVTFCGVFHERRKKEFLKEYNSLIVIDIDKLSELEFLRVKSILNADDYIFSYWESPSKKGIKGLVHLVYEFSIDTNIIDQIHKAAFQKLSNYFSTQYQIQLDESGSDTTRLCFLSFDPNIILKDNIKSFKVSEKDLSYIKEKAETNRIEKSILKGTRNALFNPLNKNNPTNRKTIQAIIKYLSKRNLSITASYDEWYRVAYAISNSFTYDIGEKYYLSLCKLDGPKFDEMGSKNMLKYCYENTSGKIHFNSIIYFASQKGYRTKLQRSEVPKMAASISKS